MRVLVKEPWAREAALRAHREGSFFVDVSRNYTRLWLKANGWPTPILGLKKKIIMRMLSSDEKFYEVTARFDARIPSDIYEEFVNRSAPN